MIKVGELDAAVDFYVKVCRFTHLRTVEGPAGAVALMDAGGQRVTLVVAPEPGVHLVLRTDDVRAERRRLVRREVPEDAQAEVGIEGGAYLDFSDPWGNALGYVETLRDR